MYVQIIAFCLIFLQISGVKSENPEVEIPQGRLSGDTRTNRDGGSYYAFKNIPFAQPPIGDLRFRAPVAADGWEGTRDATGEVPECSDQEDCLYLNVYTPGLPDENVSGLPVMVWIFGGGFQRGSASESSFGAQFLLTKEVILVAVNYRVGVFGFLNVDDSNLGVTGNQGLKDQVLGLKWVQANIQYFGGDPNNVLIFGESAGSMCTHLHLVSPASKGLFHKAIMESGVSLSDTTIPALRTNAPALAEQMGIQTDDLEEMVKSLTAASSSDLKAAQTVLSGIYGHFFTKPVVEVSSSAPTFLEELPLDIIKAGRSNQVPFIIGFNNAEEINTGIVTDFTKFIPGDFQLTSGSQEEADVAAKLKEFYFGDEEPSEDNLLAGVDLGTDYMFGFPSFRSTVLHLETALYPVYFYIFSAETTLNRSKQNGNGLPGAAHGDELGYLFYGTSTPENIEEGSLEDLGIKRMVNLWTNFAIYGHPTPDSSEGFIWEQAQNEEFHYVEIETVETVPTVDPKPDNFAFLFGLYEEYFPDTNQGTN